MSQSVEYLTQYRVDVQKNVSDIFIGGYSATQLPDKHIDLVRRDDQLGIIPAQLIRLDTRSMRFDVRTDLVGTQNDVPLKRGVVGTFKDGDIFAFPSIGIEYVVHIKDDILVKPFGYSSAMKTESIDEERAPISDLEKLVEVPELGVSIANWILIRARKIMDEFPVNLEQALEAVLIRVLTDRSISHEIGGGFKLFKERSIDPALVRIVERV